MRIYLILFAYVILISKPALAYLDPGTGSMIIGLIISFFVGIAAYTKHFWYKLKNFFSSSSKKKK